MKILVIEDNVTATTDLFELLVEKYPQHVTRINLQNEWLLKVSQTNPDVIILDVSSQDIINLMFCQKLRELTSAPILIVSVIDNPESIARALNAGADDVLIKPVSKNLLIARLNGLVKRCKGN